MLVSDRSRVAFVHVQKTGGRSVNRVLWDNFGDLSKVGLRHARWSKAVQLRPEIADYFVFGFVRNPWARLVSWYTMVSTAHERPHHAKHLRKNPFWLAARADFVDFDDFIQRGVGDPTLRPHRYRRLRLPQTAWFRDPEGRYCADFVGRTENLDADLAAVMAHLGIRIDTVPRINTSTHAGHREYYDRRNRRLVSKVFAEDIERFGYRF